MYMLNSKNMTLVNSNILLKYSETCTLYSCSNKPVVGSYTLKPWTQYCYWMEYWSIQLENVL